MGNVAFWFSVKEGAASLWSRRIMRLFYGMLFGPGVSNIIAVYSDP